MISRAATTLIILVAALVVLLDQLSKIAIVDTLYPGEVVPLIPGLFNLTLTFNPGVAFGLFANLDSSVRPLVLLFTTLLAGSVVIYLLLKDYRTDKGGQIALALIIGGALGNIIDRIRLGHVIDFLDVYYGEYHWPAFNVADSAICIGVAVLVIKGLFSRKGEA